MTKNIPKTYDSKQLYRAIACMRATYDIGLKQAVKELRAMSEGARQSWIKGSA